MASVRKGGACARRPSARYHVRRHMRLKFGRVEQLHTRRDMQAGGAADH